MISVRTRVRVGRSDLAVCLGGPGFDNFQGGAQVSSNLSGVLHGSFAEGVAQGLYRGAVGGGMIVARYGQVPPGADANVVTFPDISTTYLTLGEGFTGGNNFPAFDVGIPTVYVGQALTLIHELGHIYNDVTLLGGSAIMQPDGGPSREAARNQYNNHILVFNNCAASYFRLKTQAFTNLP